MKHLHALSLTLCLLGVCALATIQPLAAQENNKVIVIKRTVDANGDQVISRVNVKPGDDVQEIVANMENGENTVVDEIVVVKGDCTAQAKAECEKICAKNHVNALNHVNVNNNQNINVNVNESDGGKDIEIVVDGEKEIIHLEPGEDLSQEDRERLAVKGVILDHQNGVTWVGDHDFDFDMDFDFDFDLGDISESLVQVGKGIAHIGDGKAFAFSSGTRDINCAALGVYVTTSSSGGVYVNNTIGASGAEEAGLQRGDIIKSIDESPTSNYGDLHEVLSHYEPGDVVTVAYVRDGVEDRVETQLRAWKDFPSFANSRHAMVSCGDEAEEVVTKKIIVIKKDRAEEAEPAIVNESPVFDPIDNTLELQDFVAYPNPSEGKFRVQFSSEAAPTVISVYDASGKEIYREKLDRFSGVYNREIDLTAQARGGVVLSIEQEGKTYTEQIILH